MTCGASSTTLRLGARSFASAGPPTSMSAITTAFICNLSRLERRVLYALQNFRDELLFERVPVVLDGRAVQNVESLRLLHRSFHDDSLDLDDRAPAFPAGHFHRRRVLRLIRLRRLLRLLLCGGRGRRRVFLLLRQGGRREQHESQCDL